VKKLLVPIEEGKNEHKRAQLRKLAEINGTLRDNMWQPTGRTWTSADVYCKYCGEISHPTSDCPLKGKPINKDQIESEYSSFMSDIGISDNQPDEKTKTEAEKSYEDFMNSLAPKKPDLSKVPNPIGRAPWENAPPGYGNVPPPGMFPPMGPAGYGPPPGMPPPWAMHGGPPMGFPGQYPPPPPWGI